MLLTSELELLCRPPSLCYGLCSGVSYGRGTREGGDTAVQHATVSKWTPRSALGHSRDGCTTASLAAGMRSGHTSSSCILETPVGCLLKQQLAGGRDGQGVKRLVLLAPRLVRTLNALQCCHWCCANGWRHQLQSGMLTPQQQWCLIDTTTSWEFTLKSYICSATTV